MNKIYQYMLDRNQVIGETAEEQSQRIRSELAKLKQEDPLQMLKKLGVKSAPKVEILTDAQYKAKRASRFKEDSIVNAWAKWFKLQYPGIPFMIDKVAQKRSFMGGVIHKAASHHKGNPDINVQCARAGFNGLYIEQKTSEDIFYKGTRILKPGSNNQHIWQSIYHAELREQGYWVMFSISLEASMKMTRRYMDGNPYPMQAFEYRCKKEDHPIFQGYKHFRPVS